MPAQHAYNVASALIDADDGGVIELVNDMRRDHSDGDAERADEYQRVKFIKSLVDEVSQTIKVAPLDEDAAAVESGVEAGGDIGSARSDGKNGGVHGDQSFQKNLVREC